MNVDLAIINETDNDLDYEDIYLDIVKKTADILKLNDNFELSCIFVDENKIQEINKTYRGIDKVTDVISFALEDNIDIHIEGIARELGDIFICVVRAKEQAIDYGHSFYREMCFLFTHGLLHLLGYDHMNVEDEKEMFDLQDQILGGLNIER